MQEKGNISFVWGGVPIKNLAESSITYDIGELGDTVSAADAIVHLRRNPNSVVTGITANITKGTEGLNALLLAVKVGIPSPLTLNDSGMGAKLAMLSANATQVGIGDSSGGNDVEDYAFTFKGNLQIVSLEG